ncbi:MAG: DUF4824 family protein [Vicinamibacterales bacterium]
MSRLIVATIVLLGAIGGLLAAASWNRGGDPQVLTLSEREVVLAGPWTTRDADTRPQVRIRWQPREDPLDARLWLPDVTLRELGFVTGLPAGAPEARQVYGRALPRTAWVAFELAGPDWQLMEQRLRMGASRDTVDQENTVSCPSTRAWIPMRCGGATTRARS